MKVLLICMVMLIPSISFAGSWWKACDVYNLEQEWCKGISNNYTEPYCVTNLYHNDRGTSDVNYAESCIWPTLTNKLSGIRERRVGLGEFSTRGLIEQYCSTLFWDLSNWRIYFARPSVETDTWDWQQTFDSRQSLFLYSLCSSFTQNGEKVFINENAVLGDAYKTWLSISTTLSLKQPGKDKTDMCSLDVDSQITDCDIAVYAAKIYAGVMSDIFKVKYAQALHVDGVRNYEKRKKVEEFMHGYYLIDNTYEEIKTLYPKTVAILESNQEYHKNMLNSLNLLDNTKLVKMAQSSGCPVDKNMTWVDFIACALHSSQWSGFSLTPSFVTLFYNEVLHYRQFMAFYEEWLEQKIQLMYVAGESEKNVRIIESKVADFRWYFNMQMEASEWAQRSFEEFSMTYPLHIWLLSYIERAEKFRNSSLSHIITSFYSLSEKLKNVQLPS